MDKLNTVTTMTSDPTLTLAPAHMPADVGCEVQSLEDWELVLVGGGDNIPCW